MAAVAAAAEEDAEDAEEEVEGEVDSEKEVVHEEDVIDNLPIAFVRTTSDTNRPFGDNSATS